MADPKGKGIEGAVPLQPICPSCKALNEMGALTCKRCGELLGRKGKAVRKGAGEFDATEGSFSNACIIIPIVLIVGALLFFLLAFKRSTPCDHNREIIGKAIMKYDKAHPNSKMMTLDFKALMEPGPNGKPYLKEKLTCPIDPSGQYEYDGQKVTCTYCSKKKK